jgi:hypothetical protein
MRQSDLQGNEFAEASGNDLPAQKGSNNNADSGMDLLNKLGASYKEYDANFL